MTLNFPKRRNRRRSIGMSAVAAAAVAALTGAVLAASGGFAGAAAPGQEYDVPCPAADVVTPALNTNLIENPGAEDFTPATDLGAPAGDPNSLPDCWTVSAAPTNRAGLHDREDLASLGDAKSS